MFEYDVFENRTSAKLATLKFFNSELTDISSHMVVDISAGNDIHFSSSNNEDTIIIRPSITKYDIYVRDKRSIENCITEDSELSAEEAVFYAMSYI